MNQISLVEFNERTKHAYERANGAGPHGGVVGGKRRTALVFEVGDHERRVTPCRCPRYP